MLKIGILALQGNYQAHVERLQELSVSAKLVKTPNDLLGCDALILPGGESSTMLKLLDQALRKALRTLAESGLPILGTCAGLILLATNVTNPEQKSLSLLDITVCRNGYGRQLDSFIESSIELTDTGKKQLKANATRTESPVISLPSNLEGVFIRAPKITRIGPSVLTLATHQNEAVLVQQGNILGATFHPELSPHGHPFHSLLISLAQAWKAKRQAA